MKQQDLIQFLETLRKNEYSYAPASASRLYTTTIQQIQEEAERRPIRLHVHKAKKQCPLHDHSLYEMMCVVRGSITHEYEGDVYTLCPGDAFIIPTGYKHSIHSFAETDLAVNVLIDRNDLFELLSRQAAYAPGKRLIEYCEQGALYLPAPPGSHCLQYLILMLCEYFDPSTDSYSIIECLLLSLLNALCSGSFKSESTASMLDISAVLRYINANYAALTLGSVAEHFGYDPGYISTMLKKNVGYSFMELKHQRCLRAAAELLSESDLSILEIAHRSGFSNQTFFYRLFTKTYGLTPANYRKKSRLSSSEKQA